MKRRMFAKRDDAGLTAYAMILLGMTIMLFMFGFTTMWNTYTNMNESGARVSGVESIDEEDETAVERNIEITDPSLNLGVDLLNLLANSIFATLISSVTAIGILVIIILGRKNTAMWSFIIPIILLVVLNVFVFPVSAMKGDLQPYDAVILDYIGFGFTTILIVFFNLFYILAVMEFIRGGYT